MKALENKYDVVIIGAGVSGLTSAALLSKAGLSVCVLDKAQHAGGYLQGFTRKGFRFDSALHWLNQCGEEFGMVSTIFKFLGNDYPKVKHL
ncbi:MAG: phytoene dehydrogenase-like protein, partial [Planctomycetota bacterium]